MSSLFSLRSMLFIMFQLAAILLASCTFCVASPLADKSSYDTRKSEYWPGWRRISHMFVFGDSYTTTGFEVNGTQPSAANPFGNPAYPGYTSSNGPNWIDFLATTYNQSFVKTINLAYGGATVDGALIPQYLPTVLSMKQQVNDEYVPTYASHPKSFDWHSNDTLFAIFIGINDVGNAYGWSNSSNVFEKVLTEYAGLVVCIEASSAMKCADFDRTNCIKLEQRASCSSTFHQLTDHLSLWPLATQRSRLRRRQ